MLIRPFFEYNVENITFISFANRVSGNIFVSSHRACFRMRHTDKPDKSALNPTQNKDMLHKSPNWIVDDNLCGRGGSFVSSAG